jgi:DNA mismatch endonuclease, patch repair protein
MRAVKSQNTTPELLVRRTLCSLGYRYRLHRSDLPGKPDIVFPSRRKAIFVNGCFWHGHDCDRGARVPKKNRDYWEGKINRNRERDKGHITELRSKGWSAFTIWECELYSVATLANRLTCFLENDSS